MLNFFKLLLLAMLWGMSFALMKISVNDFGAATLVFLRVAIGALFLTPLLVLQRIEIPKLKTALLTALVGLLNSGLPFFFLALATKSLSAGLVSLLNASTLFFTALIAFLWLREPFNTYQATGAIISLSGLFVLLWGNFSFHPGGSAWAILLCFLAGICYAGAINISRRYLRDCPLMILSFISLLSSSLFWLPFAATDWPQQSFTPIQYLPPLLLGILSTGLAFVVYFDLIRNVGASKTASVTLLVPLFGVFWGMTILEEPFDLQILVGGIAIIAGSAMVNRINVGRIFFAKS